ncbi:MAG: DUF3021 family protein [Lachnospiraceae bacterium]|nr:DUF3021 family protein [Lachnospiraceae bacterium]
MKRGFINIFATTGLSLILLSIIATFYTAEFLFVKTVFQVFLLNVVVHLVLLLMYKIEIKYLVVEIALEIILTVAISLLFGAIFDWYTSTPLFVLVVMSITIYMISIILNILHMKQEADEINELIQIIKKE